MSLETIDPAACYTVAFLDPGSARSGVQLKRTASRSAIAVVSRDGIGHIFCRHIWGARVPVADIIKHVFEVAERLRPRIFGIESSAQQSLFEGSVELMARLESKRITFKPVDQPTRVTKEWRIRDALQLPIAERRLLVPNTLEFEELRNQIASYPQVSVADEIDALASCIRMLPPLVPQITRDAQMEARLEWLRERGADPMYIEAVAMGREAEWTGTDRLGRLYMQQFEQQAREAERRDAPWRH